MPALNLGPTLLWYDYETSGVDVAVDRPMQFAAQRTTLDLEPVGEPVNLYCKLPSDVLPHPEACLLTGITPQQVEHDGLNEAEFARAVRAELAAPGTCSVGYNSVRFDDNINRNLFYRNFLDPYAHTYGDSRARWDIVDLVRACHALRPDGIRWPQYEDGRPCFKLDRLAPENDLNQPRAHDAGSDVTATIGLARLLRDQQPKLYQWHFAARHKTTVKKRVAAAIAAGEPLVHVSSRYAAQRGCLALVVPLVEHPGRGSGNAWIVADLSVEPEAWMQLDAGSLRERLYTAREDLPEGMIRPPLKTLYANRSPFVAPLKVLRDADAERLGIDKAEINRNLAKLRNCSGLAQRIAEAQRQADAQRAPAEDAELALYDGFAPDRDKALFKRIQAAAPETFNAKKFPFVDSRLKTLLFRYRARNWPESLSTEQQQQWQAYVRDKLTGKAYDRAVTLAGYNAIIEQLRESSPAGADQAVLDQLQAWGQQVQANFGL